MKSRLILILFACLALLSFVIRSDNPETGLIPGKTSGLSENGFGMKPVVHKGMITIKVKKELGDFESMKGKVSFNMPSLDNLAVKYEIETLEKRFRFNSQKGKQGLPDLSRIYRLTFPEKYPVSRVVKSFAANPNIEYAEAIPIHYHCEVPNDAMYGLQHFLPQIQAEQAWDIHKGEDGQVEVVIGIMDTGVDWHHPDLTANIWQNLGEDADGDGQVLEWDGTQWVFDPGDINGIDDDGNGFVDDFIGWDFYNNNNDPFPEPGEDHGTHCAGLAAAVTNNTEGIASISWNLKILAVEDPTFINAYDGIIYAAESGAHIISNSWGTYTYSLANQEAVEYAIGLGSIIVAAAGNENHYGNLYPASYPGVISVASVSMQDLKAPYSNFGPNIDVSAPGGTGSQSGLFSTVLNNGYNWKQGTSMASPVTAGLLGLVKSYNPQWSNDQIITQVLGSADDIDGINPNYINMLGSGRINAYKALTETGVVLQEELRLDLFNVKPYSQDGSGILNPGDTVSLDITMRNFSYGIYANNAGFELICESPLITITMNTHSDTIPADNLFVLQDAFRFVIHDDATTQEVAFKLVTQSNVAIVYGDTLHFELLIAPEGILVFQGIGTGNAYSGDFIYDFLLNQVDNVYFTNNFPADLRGFDLVFISLGNYGQTLDNGTVISEGEAELIIQYLEDGGDLYVDCGAFFGMIQYLNMPQILDLLELFSLAGFETPLIANTIDSLHGLPGSLAEGMVFTGTTQSPVWYIDKLTPDENGTAVFHEKNYGVVAVQGEGQYGQKTFLISYAISKLVSSIPGLKEQLMVNIAQFFDLPVYTGITNPRPVTEFLLDITPNPVSGITNLVIDLPCDQPIQMDLYTLNGRHIKKVFSGIKPAGRHTLQIDMTNLHQGVYILSVQAGNEIKTQKIIKNQ